jgi:hypothetical protein
LGFGVDEVRPGQSFEVGRNVAAWSCCPEHALAKQFRRTPSPNPNSISKLLARGAFQSVWDERGRVSPQVFEFGPSRRRTKPGASSHCLIFQPFVISSNRQRSTPAGKPHLRRASLRRMSRQASTGPVVRCRSIALCRAGPGVWALSQFTARTQGPALHSEKRASGRSWEKPKGRRERCQPWGFGVDEVRPGQSFEVSRKVAALSRTHPGETIPANPKPQNPVRFRQFLAERRLRFGELFLVLFP